MALVTKFLTGFEHGLANAQVSGGPADSLFAALSGGTVQTTNKRGNGAYCGRVAPGLNGFGFFTLVTITGTKIVGRLAVRAETLPSSETTFVDVIPSAGTQAFFYVNAAGDIRAGWSTNIQAGPTGVITTTGYTLLEFQIDVAAGTFDWKVNGTAQTQSTGGSTTGTTVLVRLGRNAASGAAYAMLYDDAILGTWTTAASDWYGDGEVLWIALNADGTHSFTANDFSTGDAGTQQAPTYTLFHLMTDDALPWTTTRSTTDNVAQRVVRTTGYVELAPAAADVDGTKPTANAVRALAGLSSSSTSQTNTARCYAHNGAGDNAGVSSVNLVGTNGAPVDISVAAMEFAAGIIPPNGTGWTEAGIEAARLRFGHSGDVSPIPTLQLAGFEVDYPIIVGGTAWDPGTIADALAITDAVALSRGLTVADPLAMTDAQAFDRGLTQADALGMTDSLSSAGAFARNVDDALAITDGVVAGLLFPVAVNDALAVTDAVRMDVALALADAAGITDAAALGQSKAFADALGMTDSAAPTILKLVAVDDALAITDNVTSVAALARSVADALAVTDSLSSNAALARTIADALAITDAVAFVRELALADALGMTDAQAFAVALSLADALGLVDAATPAGGYLRTLADAAGITDAITPLWTPGVAPAYVDLGAVLTLELDSIVRTLELAGRTATLELDATERGVELDDTTRGFDLDG